MAGLGATFPVDTEENFQECIELLLADQLRHGRELRSSSYQLDTGGEDMTRATLNPFRPTRWEHHTDGRPLIWFTEEAEELAAEKSTYVYGRAERARQRC